jgi:hypothetical protein
MRYVPPFTTMEKWMAGCAVAGSTRLVVTYDDVLDILKGFLAAIPVDEVWYCAQYPAVADYVGRVAGETATTHFRKHGYFEGRKPFEPGWRGLTEPVRFTELTPCLGVSPRHGRLMIDIERDEFINVIKKVLKAVPVDEAWYFANYPKTAALIKNGTFSSGIEHYAELGYFHGQLPFDIAVDDGWYTSRYDHVRIGLERGVAGSAKDHFIRLGYSEGCRPAPP